MSNLDDKSLSADERDAIRSLPAMLYYGCSTPQAVLMRTLGVPRPIAEKLGARYGSEKRAGKGQQQTAARSWLESAPTKVWEECAPKGASLDGRGFQNVWRLLNGAEPDFS